jgi:hypothetical protein
VAFRFSGDYQILYTQYFDEATGKPLLASPGGVYEMRPAGTWDVPVPPQDGRWEAVTEDEPPEPAPSPAPPVAAPAPQPPAAPAPDPDVTGDTSPAQPA